jgi:hypothetical protein
MKMKNLLFLATMTLTFGFAKAQSQINYYKYLPNGYKMKDVNGNLGPTSNFDFDKDGKKDLVFNLYRIIDSFDYQAISFIKTTKLDIYPIGITDGRPGIKSFLSNFPIILKWDNLSKGQIHIFQDDEIFINVIKKTRSFRNVFSKQ